MPSGVINVLKPPGPTSQDLVTDIKRLLGEKKVGHTGTLDPMAAGVLPICLGKATRLFDTLAEKDKRYRFEMQLGVSTDTLDCEGEITQRIETKPLSKEEFAAVLPNFMGRIRQEPPMYSALKWKGQSLHQIARKGGEEEAEIRRKKAREVQIHELTLCEQTGENRFLLDLHCSKGTYVRVIVEQIAAALGTVGVLTFLLRNASGRYKIEDALTLDEIAAMKQAGCVEDCIEAVDDALSMYPKCQAADKEYAKLRNGNMIDWPQDAAEGICRLYCQGEFFGLAEKQQDKMHISTMFWEESPKK